MQDGAAQQRGANQVRRAQNHEGRSRPYPGRLKPTVVQRSVDMGAFSDAAGLGRGCTWKRPSRGAVCAGTNFSRRARSLTTGSFANTLGACAAMHCSPWGMSPHASGRVEVLCVSMSIFGSRIATTDASLPQSLITFSAHAGTATVFSPIVSVASRRAPPLETRRLPRSRRRRRGAHSWRSDLEWDLEPFWNSILALAWRTAASGSPLH